MGRSRAVGRIHPDALSSRLTAVAPESCSRRPSRIGGKRARVPRPAHPGLVRAAGTVPRLPGQPVPRTQRTEGGSASACRVLTRLRDDEARVLAGRAAGAHPSRRGSDGNGRHALSRSGFAARAALARQRFARPASGSCRGRVSRCVGRRLGRGQLRMPGRAGHGSRRCLGRARPSEGARRQLQSPRAAAGADRQCRGGGAARAGPSPGDRRPRDADSRARPPGDEHAVHAARAAFRPAEGGCRTGRRRTALARAQAATCSSPRARPKPWPPRSA